MEEGRGEVGFVVLGFFVRVLFLVVVVGFVIVVFSFLFYVVL